MNKTKIRLFPELLSALHNRGSVEHNTDYMSKGLNAGKLNVNDLCFTQPEGLVGVVLS